MNPLHISVTMVRRLLYTHRMAFKAAAAIFLLVTLYLYARLSGLGREEPSHRTLSLKPLKMVQPQGTEPLSTEVDRKRNMVEHQNGLGDEYPRKKKLRMSLTDPVHQPPPPPPLPTCAPHYKPAADFVVLDTLRSCGDWKTYQFEPELELWRYRFSVQCQGRFVSFDNEAALLRDIILERPLIRNRHNATKRENVNDIPIHLEQGFFKVLCNKTIKKPLFKGGEGNHLNAYMNAVKNLREPMLVDEIIPTFTIAVTRYEFQNIYHTMSDMFNAFLAMKFLSVEASDTNVLLLDTHPNSPLDQIWSTLFDRALRIGDLRTRTEFKMLFWNVLGYSSQFIFYSQPRIPYIKEFRNLMLQRYNIADQHTDLNCNRLRLVLIRRVNDFDLEKGTHRNISRKIANEEELLLTIQNRYPDWKVSAVVMEEMQFREQLSLIIKTDVLVGMHGAGLTHALFLPEHAGLIEFIPKYWDLADGHFQGIARWRHLKYIRWRNEDEHNEVQPRGMSTIIPPDIMLKYLAKMMQMMC